MKKQIENKWVQLILYIVITIIVAIILIPILDYFYCIITKNHFVYNIYDHIQKPIEYGIILGIINYVIQRRNKKEEK